MEDWNKFGDSDRDSYTGFTMRDPNPQSQSAQTDSSAQTYYTGYSEPVNTN